MKDTFFITGISTEVGKTVVAAIVTEALQADYWKPVQAGDLDRTDTDKIRDWVYLKKSAFHPPAYLLNTPMSPHAAAEIDRVAISLKNIKRPVTSNTLVIEGAGGLMVPLNKSDMIIDLIRPTDKVIVVSRHYLGSINHTLLTIEALKARKLNIFGIVFVGDELFSTESVIKEISQVPVIGRMDMEPYIDHHVIKEYAEAFRKKLI